MLRYVVVATAKRKLAELESSLLNLVGDVSIPPVEIQIDERIRHAVELVCPIILSISQVN